MQVRNTKQKQVVSEVISEAKRPLTVHEILQKGQKLLPSLGLATVYREIARLTDAHEINAVYIHGDLPRYEIHKHHHHHFKCNACTKVYELEGCSDVFKNMIPKGFKPEHHDLTFYGLCSSCAKKA